MVVGIHTDLVVAREGVHEAKEFMTGSGVHYEVNRGRGKLSFGQALLISVKLMQSLHLPFFFMRTTLANHSGYSTSLIASGWRSLPTSSLITFCLSRVKLLFFCLTGLKDRLMFNLWVITVGSIPPMSSCFQANTSVFCFKKWM